ncbi:MAG: hypothetical protein NT004_07910 [Bacteroidetes bacterium]|nr:hypothetical protein [Bacteroidota bacterium]
MEDSLKQRLQTLLQREKNGLILSTSMMEHFKEVVEIMDAIGAQRQGSAKVKDQNGKNCIADIYILPNGRKIQAGYPDMFS